MSQTLRAKVTVGMAALLLLGGGALMSGPNFAAPQSGSAPPAATEPCTAQDAAATAEPTQSADADMVDLQCGDQTTADGTDATASESSIEPTESANDKGGDNVDQQGDNQDAGDTQPDAANSGK